MRKRLLRTTIAFLSNGIILVQVPGGGVTFISVSIGPILMVSTCTNTTKRSLFNAQKTAENDHRVLEQWHNLLYVKLIIIYLNTLFFETRCGFLYPRVCTKPLPQPVETRIHTHGYR